MTRPGTHGNDPRREPLDPDERALAERLARLGPHGEPPGAIDARILAAAHAATNATPRRTRRLPLALGAAASLVLALGLAWQLRTLLDPPPPSESASADMAAPQVDRSKAAAPATEPAQERAAAGDDAAEARPDARVAGPDRAQEVAAEPAAPPPPNAQATVKPEAFPSPAAPFPPQPSPPPPAPPPPAPAARTAAPAAPAPSADTAATEAAAAGTRGRAAESRRHLEPRRDAAPQAMQESAAADDGLVARETEAHLRQAQLARIRELRDAGHIAQARDELDAFLARWPGYPLPDDLQPLRR